LGKNGVDRAVSKRLSTGAMGRGLGSVSGAERHFDAGDTGLGEFVLLRCFGGRFFCRLFGFFAFESEAAHVGEDGEVFEFLAEMLEAAFEAAFLAVEVDERAGLEETVQCQGFDGFLIVFADGAEKAIEGVVGLAVNLDALEFEADEFGLLHGDAIEAPGDAGKFEDSGAEVGRFRVPTAELGVDEGLELGRVLGGEDRGFGSQSVLEGVH
jgi:hypothetical protein